MNTMSSLSPKKYIKVLLQELEKNKKDYPHIYNRIKDAIESHKDIKDVGGYWFIQRDLMTGSRLYHRPSVASEAFFKLHRHVIGIVSGRTKFEELKRQVKPIKCVICNKNKTLEVHHIIPLCDGGKNEIDNLVILCKSHHSRLSKYHGTFWVVKPSYHHGHWVITPNRTYHTKATPEEIMQDEIFNKEYNIKRLENIKKDYQEFIGKKLRISFMYFTLESKLEYAYNTTKDMITKKFLALPQEDRGFKITT